MCAVEKNEAGLGGSCVCVCVCVGEGGWYFKPFSRKDLNDKRPERLQGVSHVDMGEGHARQEE